MSVVVEICVCGIDGALAAERGGADRIELNAALPLGGTTPSLGVVKSVLAETTIPVIAMLRPRESGFCYSDAEFNVMRQDLDALLAVGVHGIAFGLLQPDGSIDVPRCRQLLSQFNGQDAVFHRAFDLVSAPIAALAALEELGVHRVMTSGQAASAESGFDRIREFVESAEIEILAAGGIRPHNASALIAATGCRQVHAALLKTERDPSAEAAGVSFSAQRADDESGYQVTDEAQVRALVQALRHTLDQP